MVDDAGAVRDVRGAVGGGGTAGGGKLAAEVGVR